MQCVRNLVTVCKYIILYLPFIAHSQLVTFDNDDLDELNSGIPYQNNKDIFPNNDFTYNPFYVFAIPDFSIAQPIEIIPKQNIKITWPKSFFNLKLTFYNKASNYTKLTIATTPPHQPYKRFIIEFTHFNNNFAKQRSIINYWKAIKKNQKLISKIKGCKFYDHLLRISEIRIIYTKKMTECNDKKGTFITFGKILKGEDGFYHINYQHQQHKNKSNKEIKYKLAIHNSELIDTKNY